MFLIPGMQHLIMCYDVAVGLTSLALDWLLKKKRESRTCCSFHKRRLWNCPVELNEQTCRSLTQNMCYASLRDAHASNKDRIYIST